MQRIVVLGGGFAGLWSAVGAARALAKHNVPRDNVEILLIDRRMAHSIRVRNYECDLAPTLVPFASVLDPVGVRHLSAEVTDIDLASRTVCCVGADGPRTIVYERLVLALGSQLVRPAIPGLDGAAFDVDSYEAARRLDAHIAGLPNNPDSPGRATALVVGAGLTGIEAAAEMPGRLRAAWDGRMLAPRVILADHKPWIGSDMGESARPIIATALAALGVETRAGVVVTSIDKAGATLASGERLPAETIVWCAGMQANPMAARFPAPRDALGRLRLDSYLRIEGQEAAFGAGDIGWLPIDGARPSVMSCQHARPMGRFAGHNAACNLLGKPLLKLRIDWYATILDLGPWGAVHTEGWDRQVVASGAAAKRTKEMINCVRIYPPNTSDPRLILDAAAPVVQVAPQRLS